MDFFLRHSRINRIPFYPTKLKRSTSTNHTAIKRKDSFLNAILSMNSDSVNMGRAFRFPVSPEDRKRLTSSWAKIQDLQSLGSDIFIQIFMYRPALKRLFGLETVAANQLPKAPAFVKHVTNFTKFIDKIVTSLEHSATAPPKDGVGGDGSEDENDEEIEALRMAVKLGIFHVKVSKTVKFDPAYWTLFNHAICDQVKVRLSKYAHRPKNGHNLDKDMRAWDCLFAFVTREMQEAYNKQLEIEAEQERRRKSSSLGSLRRRKSSCSAGAGYPNNDAEVRRLSSAMDRKMSITTAAGNGGFGGRIERKISAPAGVHHMNRNSRRTFSSTVIVRRTGFETVSASAPLSKQASVSLPPPSAAAVQNNRSDNNNNDGKHQHQSSAPVINQSICE